MPQKGTTNNPAGRPVGSPNKVTKQVRESLQEALSGEIEKIGKLLESLEPKDRLEIIVKLLQYILPKLESETVNFERNWTTEMKIEGLNGKVI